MYMSGGMWNVTLSDLSLSLWVSLWVCVGAGREQYGAGLRHGRDAYRRPPHTTGGAPSQLLPLKTDQTFLPINQTLLSYLDRSLERHLAVLMCCGACVCLQVLLVQCESRLDGARMVHTTHTYTSRHDRGLSFVSPLSRVVYSTGFRHGSVLVLSRC